MRGTPDPSQDERAFESRTATIARRARDIFARVSAGGVVLLLLTTTCDTLILPSTSDIDCSADDPDAEGTSTDGDDDGDGVVDCADGDSTAGGNVHDAGLGGSIDLDAAANGDSADVGIFATHTTCYEATDSDDPTATFMTTGGRVDIFCPDNTGSAVLHASMSVIKNDEAPIDLVDATATLSCDQSVTPTDPWQCQASIPGRFFCSIQFDLFDAVASEPGDTLESILTFEVHNELGGSGGGQIETTGGVIGYLSGAGLNAVPCPGEGECETSEECGDTEECLDNECVELSFASSLDADIVTDPTPLGAGQTFTATAHLSTTDGDLLPYQTIVSVSSDAVDLNGTLPAGVVGGGCDVGGLAFPIIGGQNEGELFVDVDQNATFDPEVDASIDYGDDGAGEFVFTILTPSSTGRLTVPADADISCTLNSFFISGADGIYPVHVEATSLDIDSGDTDDGAGTDPLTFIDDFDFVVGEPPPLACGDPAFIAGTVGDGPPNALVTASDALFVLRTAVGSETCQLCVCDVDNSGTVAASDALVTLKAAVGQQVTLSCPACS